MFEGDRGGGFGAFVLIGGALFLRPADLYTMARLGGRLCGSGVLHLRRFRKALSDTIAAESPAPEFAGMRETVLKSFQKLESITRTVSREVADSSPVAGLRAATSFTPKRRTPATETSPSPSDAPSNDAQPSPKLASVSTSGEGAESGARIIARVIEQGAFAQQQAKILGSTSLDSIEDEKGDER